MTRGPKPQPASVRDQKEPVRSAHQPRPNYADALTSGTSSAVAPPKWLKKEGLRIWQRLAPTLTAAKLLTQADAETFARYCRNFARWLKMEAVLDAEGETYETETYGAALEEGAAAKPGTKLKRAHPAFLIADRLERQLLAAEDRFGLNPAERQRIMQARAQTGVSGDLFAPPAKPHGGKRPDDAAAQPTAPAEPIEAPEGFLN